MSGINMSNVKLKNRSSILKLLRNQGSMSRKDISEKIGLTAAAVSNLISDLIAEDLVSEIGEVDNGVKKSGRREILIDVNYDKYSVVAIDIGIDFTKIAIGNLAGEIKDSTFVKTNKEISPAEFLKELAQKVITFLWENNQVKDDILGFGVGMIGLVDSKKGLSKHAYGLWDQEVKIKEKLEELLEMKVVVDNNVRALALAEINRNDQVTGDNILFIKYGPGIGSAIILNNEIYYGSNNMAGEIGHMIIDNQGEKCRCGRRGCLETKISQKAIIKYIADNCSIKIDKNGKNKELDLEKVFTDLKSSCQQEILNNISFNLALSVANVIALYDPCKIILHGKPFEYPDFLESLKTNFNKIIPEIDLQNFIIASKLNAGYISGISLAVERLFYDFGGKVIKE
ncbi:hypothetical protein HSACCH_00721 [Halanaerobium saccharolyticum subsp. saccharolyticum DSM 6643]|uniref:HTH crp-type domain-containing protein n=1 Tax=Halanaerobium saccharolyticum subsp. saccharolyticum DSM 6643 TaxID=1293054 RepID=M5ECF3_9FIRM|nr:ROK family transcriptional regulator [Halanaerobium saccharolyticum]CCU78572.1 hypothetical protein HSACCH_00721 [Halanaerobium saccharolyticum subsp. saccharolyticum DSM 6643]